MLVVEDDPQVLDVVTRILRKGGYHAIPARDGREAWGIFQRAERPLLIWAYRCGDAAHAGTELAARVAAKAPDLPIVLMSGFTSKDLARRGLVLSHGHLLTKPFGPTELLDLIGQLLPA